MGERKLIRADSVTPRTGGGVLHMRNGTPFRCTCASPLFSFLLLSCCFPFVCVTVVMLLCVCGVMCYVLFAYILHQPFAPHEWKECWCLERSVDGGLGARLNQSINRRKTDLLGPVYSIDLQLPWPPFVGVLSHGHKT